MTNTIGTVSHILTNNINSKIIFLLGSSFQPYITNIDKLSAGELIAFDAVEDDLSNHLHLPLEVHNIKQDTTA